MLTIRLFRVGKKNQPAYKIVVTEKLRSSTRGRFVEEVGFYNPLTKQRNLKGDRVKYWISVGAKPSDTVHNMLVTDQVIDAPKIAKHKIVPKKEEEAPAAEAEKPAESVSSADQQAPAEAKEETSPKTAPKPTPETPAEPEKPTEPSPAEELKTEETKN